MNRRTFLQTQSIALAGLSTGLTAFSPPTRRLKSFGIISGLIKQALEENWEGTLEQITEWGYQELEFSGFYGPSKAAFRAKLKELNLNAIAGGSSLSNLQENLNTYIDEALFFDKKYVICYWPWLHSGENIKLEDIHYAIEEFNRIGAICKAEGLTFAFHNHDKEFYPVEGAIPYELFLQETDPVLVKMEIDLYWIHKGGGNVFDYFERYPGRFPICHVKDATAEKDFACVGEGTLDFSTIFKQAKKAGLQHFIVERDRSPSPMACAKTAAEYLKTLRF